MSVTVQHKSGGEERAMIRPCAGRVVAMFKDCQSAEIACALLSEGGVGYDYDYPRPNSGRYCVTVDGVGPEILHRARVILSNAGATYPAT
jgi:hypothetical protein